LLDILKETGLSGSNLELEITENLLLDDRCELKEIIDDLHDLGIKFSIDDFGTGYSSLSYLKQFPVDTLKVDRGFLKDVPDSDDACAIVKTIVMMAHTLKMKVIAEGIENIRQLDFLRSIHCNVGQGYYYHAPLGQDEFAGFCISYNTKANVRSV
jgi:EAL domain-containing protein (putative c-di-GMP-specific phosphodiesterase class I)